MPNDRDRLQADLKRHERKADRLEKRRKGLLARAKELLRRAVYQRALVARRKRQIAKLKPSGAKRAVQWALAQVGTTESPYGSNWGPKISDWIKASGYVGPVPWCQCFANAAAVQGGAPQLKTGYTPAVLDGEGDYRPISHDKAEPGDFVFFKFPGVSSDRCDHVGVLTKAPRQTGSTVESAEGNTDSSSQNNGGRVELRVRPKSIVAGYVRPPYPKG